MPTDPALTLTTTTHPADFPCRTAIKQQRAGEAAFDTILRLRSENERLRSRLARAEAIEGAARDVLEHVADWEQTDAIAAAVVDGEPLIRLAKALGVPAPNAAEVPVVSSSDPCPDDEPPPESTTVDTAWFQRLMDWIAEVVDAYECFRTSNVDEHRIDLGEAMEELAKAYREHGVQPGPAKPPSIVASLDALRAAGGDAWDGVEDVEGELGLSELTAEKAEWLVEESTVYTLDERGDNRIYANFQAANAKHYDERCELARRCAAVLNAPSQTEAERENERLRGENERLHEATAEAKREHYAEIIRADGLRAEIERLRERLETRINMTERLHKLCDEHGRAIAERDGTIGTLREENHNLHATIAELERQAVDAADVPRLKAELAAYEAREAETDRRCEAVVKAFDEHRSQPSCDTWRAIFNAVDALRPARDAEVRA